MRVVASVLVFSLVACISRNPPTNKGDAATGDGGLTTAELASLDGPALYGKLCAICHGADGTGYRADNAPSLVNKTFVESATEDQLRRSIVHGRPGTAMAGYGKEVGGPLDAMAVSKLTTWIRSHGTLPVSLPLVGGGDSKRGEPLYTANCQRCHGTVEARGNAVHLMNPKFLEMSPDPFLKWAIVHGRPGTPMESWEQKLTSPQTDDVIAYIRSFDKSPHVTLLAPPTGTEPVVINPDGKQPAFKPRSTACNAADPKCKPDERFVSVEQVKQALDEKRKMVIIDARAPSDWMRVHIPGAVSIPYHDMKRLSEIPNDGTWILAYCACPHHLSGDVVNELRKRGYKHAAILDEGILEWHRRHYPVVAAPGVEPPPRGPEAPPLPVTAPKAGDAGTRRLPPK